MQPEEAEAEAERRNISTVGFERDLEVGDAARRVVGRTVVLAAAMEFSRVRLPPELIVKIAHFVARSDVATVGRSLASLLRVSATVHQLLRREEDSLWNAACLARFPRILGILNADPRYSAYSRFPPGFFRLQFANQLRAERRDADYTRDLCHQPPALRDFVFTIEIFFDGVLQGSFSGTYKSADELKSGEHLVWEDDKMPDFIYSRVWDDENEVGIDRCTCSAYVTYEFRTICIVREASVIQNDKPEGAFTGTSWASKYDDEQWLIMFDQSLVMHQPSEDEPERPAIDVILAPHTGQVLILFSTEVDNEPMADDRIVSCLTMLALRDAADEHAAARSAAPPTARLLRPAKFRDA